MQPYFFPYLGYYDLINRVDVWVVFDLVKYRPKSWMNRNRILHPAAGWQYVTAPVSIPTGGCSIKNATLCGKAAAHRRILAQIEHYRKKKAPFFEAVRNVVDKCFKETASDLLCELNVRSLAGACAYLGIHFEPLILSALDLELPEITKPGDWALEIASALHAQEYVNLSGGRELFEATRFEARGITLSFVEPMHFRYAGREAPERENLSIIDVMMWNSPESIKAFLDSRTSRP